MPIIFAHFSSEIFDGLLPLRQSQKEFGLSMNFISAFNSLPPPLPFGAMNFSIIHKYNDSLNPSTIHHAYRNRYIYILATLRVRCTHSYYTDFRSNLLVSPNVILIAANGKTAKNTICDGNKCMQSVVIPESYLPSDMNFYCAFPYKMETFNSRCVQNSLSLSLSACAIYQCLHISLKAIWISASNQLNLVK